LIELSSIFYLAKILLTVRIARTVEGGVALSQMTIFRHKSTGSVKVGIPAEHKSVFYAAAQAAVHSVWMLRSVMRNANSDRRYQCGAGGCSAPTWPDPVFFPSLLGHVPRPRRFERGFVPWRRWSKLVPQK